MYTLMGTCTYVSTNTLSAVALVASIGRHRWLNVRLTSAKIFPGYYAFGFIWYLSISTIHYKNNGWRA